MPSTYELLVTLDHIHPPVWRRLRVPDDTRLDRLHAVIQAVFGWTNSHLHQFLRIGPRGRIVAQLEMPNPDIGAAFPDDLERLDERAFTVADELKRPRARLGYEYDFGDSWLHTVELVAIIAQTTRSARAILLDGARACPPDDSGGPMGHEMNWAAARDPEHPNHADFAEWYGDFDPEKFDLAKTDRALARVKV
jgi:hypothetical protein